MVISIDNHQVPTMTLMQLQMTSGWDSVFNTGRLILRADTFVGALSAPDSSIFVGSEVEISFSETREVFYKILAFNLLQTTEGDGATIANAIEFILISSWYFDDALSSATHYGNSSSIAKRILEDFEDVHIEDMADPHRKRYQLGVTSLFFLETSPP